MITRTVPVYSRGHDLIIESPARSRVESLGRRFRAIGPRRHFGYIGENPVIQPITWVNWGQTNITPFGDDVNPIP